jgi:hypothetical protein
MDYLTLLCGGVSCVSCVSGHALEWGLIFLPVEMRTVIYLGTLHQFFYENKKRAGTLWQQVAFPSKYCFNWVSYLLMIFPFLKCILEFICSINSSWNSIVAFYHSW